MAISISDSPDTISRPVDYKLLAHDAYDELRHIASRQPGRETAAMLYRMLESFCLELTRELSFPSLFARLDYVCREAGLKGNQQFAIQRLRFRLHSGDAAHDSKADYQEDLALMADFIHQVCRVSAPSQWRLGPLSMLQSAMKIPQNDFAATLMNMKLSPTSVASDEDLGKLAQAIAV